MPKVTERLRDQWRWQRIEAEEERMYSQSGRKRPAEDIVEQDFEIVLMDHLLSLPLGSTFDGQEEQAKLRATYDFAGQLARVNQTYASFPDRQY